VGAWFGGTQGLVIAFVIALATNAFAYWNSGSMALRSMRARPVSEAEQPVMYRVVREIATQQRQPMPTLHVSPTMAPNAFATGRNPRNAAVCCTEGILQLLDERELRGVLAHELAHVRNRDVLVATVAAGLATAISHVGNLLAFSGLTGGRDGEEGGGNGGLLFALAAPFGAMLVQLGISRSREYLADQTGARLSGDPLALASALEKLQREAEEAPAQAEPAAASLYIVNPFGALGGLTRLFSTHPPAEERVRRLRAMALASPGNPLIRGAAPRRLQHG